MSTIGLIPHAGKLPATEAERRMLLDVVHPSLRAALEECRYDSRFQPPSRQMPAADTGGTGGDAGDASARSRR